MKAKITLLISATLLGVQSLLGAQHLLAQSDTIPPVDTIAQYTPIAPQEQAQRAALVEPQPSALQELDTRPRPKFLWGVRFETKFDNHENDGLKHLAPAVISQTLFSIRFAPLVGIGWDDRHAIMAGGSFTIDMSRYKSAHPIEPLLYYRYRSPEYSLYAGKFEGRHLIGSYSRAIYGGISAFYDNVMDGFALQYHPVQGKLELVLDWDGLMTATTRESFRVLSAGEFYPVKTHSMRWFTMGYSFDMYHLAARTDALDGVVDHISVSPWIGAAFHRLAPWFERLDFSIGWLQMFDRIRIGGGDWMMPGGGTVEFRIQKWRVGIHNRFYYGDRLMPLRGILGPELGLRIYRGDPFYSASKLYNFTRIYWNPRIGRGIDLELSVGLHTDGKGLGFQQTAGVGVTLDREFFTFKRRKARKLPSTEL